MNAEIVVASTSALPGPLASLLGSVGILLGGILDRVLGVLGGGLPL